jgi:hypothetical protein
MKYSMTLLSGMIVFGAASIISLPAQANLQAPVQLAQTPLGDTYTAVRTDGGIDIQITSGNQRISTTLRPGENSYIGQDRIFVVTLIPSTGQVTVYSSETGETFYDYYTTPVDFNNVPGATSVARSSTPTTYMTPQGPNEIIVQITDGNFYFRDVMHRGYGNTYQATDHGIRVTYDRDSGRVVVISNETGEEFYNYFFSEPSSVSNSNANSYDDYTTGPPSFAELLRVADNEYAAEFSEGQFYFNGPLYRSSGDVFVGSDGRFRVMYDRGNNRVLIINLTTGEELFNYIYSEVDEGFL